MNCSPGCPHALIIVREHGIGGRTDLPVPLWAALYGGAAAVLVSFVAVMAFWSRSRLRGDLAGRPVPPGVQAVLDARATRVALRVLGMLLAAVVLFVALAGPDDSARNPAPTWFHAWFWVGLAVVSALAGPFWRLLNPGRGVAGVIRLLIRREAGLRPLPERFGYWPAAVALSSYLWLELVYDHADVPHVVAGFLIGYGLVQVAGGVVFGDAWFARCDGFEAYSNLLSLLAPIGRRADGRLVVRNPLDGLASLKPAPGLVAFVAVMLGSTGFDGLSREGWWRNLVSGESRPARLGLATLGLAAAIGLVLWTYRAACRVTQRYAPRASAMDVRFVHSLLPISLGYSVAHYFSFAVFQGQDGYLLAGDPLGRGWNLFGLAGTGIDYRAVSPWTISMVQVGAIVVGHVLGVLSAHDRAMGTFTPRLRRVGQYPLLTTMVAFTMGGIALVLRA